MGLGGQAIHYPYETLVRVLIKSGYRVLRFDNRDGGLSTHFCGRLETPNIISHRLVHTTNVAMNYLMSGFGLFKSSYWNDIQSKPPQYTLVDMATDVRNLLDSLKIDRAHIAGASMGGMISQTFAVEFPERVLSLTSIMSSTNQRRGDLDASLFFLSKIFLRRVPSFMQSNTVEEYNTRSQEWIEFGIQGDKIFGSGYESTSDGGYAFYDIAKRSIRRTLRYENFNKDGTLRQTTAIEKAPSRDDAMKKLAPSMNTLIIHGTEDYLVPTQNAYHLYALMANSILDYNESTKSTLSTSDEDENNAITDVDSTPRLDEYNITLQPTRNPRTTYTETNCNNGNYVRLAMIAHGHHDFSDYYVLSSLNVILEHLHAADVKNKITNPYNYLTAPWTIPKDEDVSEPGSNIVGLGSVLDESKRKECEKVLHVLIEEGTYHMEDDTSKAGQYFPTYTYDKRGFPIREGVPEDSVFHLSNHNNLIKVVEVVETTSVQQVENKPE